VLRLGRFHRCYNSYPKHLTAFVYWCTLRTLTMRFRDKGKSYCRSVQQRSFWICSLSQLGTEHQGYLGILFKISTTSRIEATGNGLDFFLFLTVVSYSYAFGVLPQVLSLFC